MPPAPATPEYCPNCGGPLKPRATSCKACGSCEKTGWNARAEYDRIGVDYDDDDFDYQDFIAREFSDAPQNNIHGRSLLFTIVALILTILLIASFIAFF